MRAVQVDGDVEPERTAVSAAAIERVTRTVRLIEIGQDEPLSLVSLAREAKLSPFHYLRAFDWVWTTCAGVTHTARSGC